jgi:hypothetical protein
LVVACEHPVFPLVGGFNSAERNSPFPINKHQPNDHWMVALTNVQSIQLVFNTNFIWLVVSTPLKKY